MKINKQNHLFPVFLLFCIFLVKMSNPVCCQECKSEIMYMDLGGRSINQAGYLPETGKLVIVCEEGGDIYFRNIEDQKESNRITLGEMILFSSFSSDKKTLLAVTANYVFGIDTYKAVISYKYKNPGLFSYYAPQTILDDNVYFYNIGVNDYLIINTVNGSIKKIKSPAAGKHFVIDCKNQKALYLESKIWKCMDFKGSKIEVKVCSDYKFIPHLASDWTVYEYFSESNELVCFNRTKNEFFSFSLQSGKVTKILSLPKKYSNLSCYSDNGKYLISYTDRSESGEQKKMFVYYPKFECIKFEFLDLNTERYLGEYNQLLFYTDDTGSFGFLNNNNQRKQIVYGVRLNNAGLSNISDGRYVTFCDHNKVAVFDCLDRKVLIYIVNKNY